MMSNVSDIKPWFREDLARMLMSVYFASKSKPSPSFDYAAKGAAPLRMEEDGYSKGFAAALASVALAVGLNPESFLSPEDIQRLRSGR